MAQYDLYYSVARAGQIVDCSLRDIKTRGTNSTIEFGAPLKVDTADPNNLVVTWGDAITTKFVGIAVISPTEVSGNYQAKSAVSVLTFGRIWVVPKNSITIVSEDLAYLEATTGNYTNVATNNLLIGKFGSPIVDGLVQLEIR